MKEEIIDKLSTLISGALALVAALAWNSAIQSIFKELFGVKEGIIAMLIYAMTVTIIAVIATIVIVKIMNRMKEIDLINIKPKKTTRKKMKAKQ